MIKTFIFFIIFIFLSSCDWTSARGGEEAAFSSQVQIFASPYASGDEVQPRRPLAGFSTSSQSLICRPFPINLNRAFRNLRAANLEQEAIKNLFQFNDDEYQYYEESRETLNGSARQRIENLKSIRVSAAGGWIKLGLIFNNNSEFNLIIDSILYYGQAFYNNRCAPLIASGTIGNDYCKETKESEVDESSEEGAEDESSEAASRPESFDISFLYLIPAGHSVLYKPVSTNFLENLTLYLDNFPYIDNSDQPHPNLQSRLDNFQNRNTNEGGREGESRTQGQGDECSMPRIGDPIIHFPSYRIQLTFRGYFISQKGNTIFPFSKIIHFTNDDIKSGRFY